MEVRRMGWDRNPDVRRSCSSTKGPDGLLLAVRFCVGSWQLAVEGRERRERSGFESGRSTIQGGSDVGSG